MEPLSFNQALLADDVQLFIRENVTTSIPEIALKKSPFAAVTSQELAQQVFGYQKLLQKAPSFLKEGIIFPLKLNIEQSSSEQTALYKQQIIGEVESIIDLTGGFGIDTYFLSQQAEKTIYCELNEQLIPIVRHNFSLLNSRIIVHHGNGLDHLKQLECIDLAYIDPSRRTEKGRVISLEDAQPNLLEYWNLLLSKSNCVLVKLSPMLDLSYLMNTLSALKEIHVISVKNDVKELLLIAEKNYQGTCRVIATEINQQGQFSFSEEKQMPFLAETKEQTYLYEPLGVLLKANLQDAYANQFGLKKLAYKSNFYLSNELVHAPLMKRFKLQQVVPFQKKQLKKKLAKQPINVVCRNFPLKPEQVLQQLNLKQGGEQYLICSTAQEGQKVCFLAERK